MALVKGENSYITLNEADSYFEGRADVNDWDIADASLKEQAIITSTAYLEDLAFVGQAVDANQMLSFPRTGTFRDPSRGLRAQLSSSYTFNSGADELESEVNRDIRLLRKVTYELAYHIINNEGLFDSADTIESIKVGPIELTDIKSGSKVPSHIHRSLSPLMANSSRYWRWGF
jgi:hypothetical protein